MSSALQLPPSPRNEGEVVARLANRRHSSLEAAPPTCRSRDAVRFLQCNLCQKLEESKNEAYKWYEHSLRTFVTCAYLRILGCQEVQISVNIPLLVSEIDKQSIAKQVCGF